VFLNPLTGTRCGSLQHLDAGHAAYFRLLAAFRRAIGPVQLYRIVMLFSDIS